VKIGFEADVLEIKQAESLEILVHLIVTEASYLQNWRRRSQYVLTKCSTSPIRRHGPVIAKH